MDFTLILTNRALEVQEGKEEEMGCPVPKVIQVSLDHRVGLGKEDHRVAKVLEDFRVRLDLQDHRVRMVLLDPLEKEDLLYV